MCVHAYVCVYVQRHQMRQYSTRVHPACAAVSQLHHRIVCWGNNIDGQALVPNTDATLSKQLGVGLYAPPRVPPLCFCVNLRVCSPAAFL